MQTDQVYINIIADEMRVHNLKNSVIEHLAVYARSSGIVCDILVQDGISRHEDIIILVDFIQLAVIHTIS